MSRIRNLVIVVTIGALSLAGCVANGSVPPAGPAAAAPAMPSENATTETTPSDSQVIAAFVEAVRKAQLIAFYEAVAFNAWVEGVRRGQQLDPTLTCIRHRESDRGPYPNINGYGLATGNGYYGAYQFLASTWRTTALHAGRPDLAGLRPNQAAWYDQDAMTLHLIGWQGMSPWGGRCRY